MEVESQGAVVLARWGIGRLNVPNHKCPCSVVLKGGGVSDSKPFTEGLPFQRAESVTVGTWMGACGRHGIRSRKLRAEVQSRESNRKGLGFKLSKPTSGEALP